ncbi:kinase-like domain-containing protein [Nemania sp. FL0916]|nr:kinase-like domain-containing protein [Nemania sp. FL0916]
MTLRKDLRDAREECLITKRQRIRPDSIHKIITAESIKGELRSSTWIGRLFSSRGLTLEDKVQRASKIIAILALIDKSGCIDTLLNDGLTDDHLPLVEDGNCLRSQCGERSFESFDPRHGDKHLAEMFLEHQWDVWVPILNFEPGVLTQISLHSSSSLPFDCEEIATTGYSAVYKGTLWPLYHKGINDKPQDKGCIAVKQFKDAPKPDDKDLYYQQELKNLERIRTIVNEHLSQPLACCEQARSIFFPWATGGDLCNFWEANGPQKLQRTPEIFLWTLRQICGITHALEAIHQVSIRHGDLKPSNILHFTDGTTELGILKIADFGVSKEHMLATGLRSDPTITKASTFTYEAPEAHDSFKSRGSRSRRYDCWSLGCIILESIIWFLYDCDAIVSCRSQRDAEHYSYYRPIPGSDPRNKAIEDVMEVHPVTDTAIREMERHVWFKNTAVESIVELVTSNLLKIKPEERLGAGDTRKALQEILATAQKDLSPFTKEADPLLIPPFFRHKPPKTAALATYEERKGVTGNAS